MAMNEIVMVASIVTAVWAMVRTSLASALEDWIPAPAPEHLDPARKAAAECGGVPPTPVQPGEAGGVRVLAGLERPRVQRSVVSRRRG